MEPGRAHSYGASYTGKFQDCESWLAARDKQLRGCPVTKLEQNSDGTWTASEDDRSYTGTLQLCKMWLDSGRALRSYEDRV